MSDIYLAISETPTVVTLTSAVINSAVASSVTVTNTVTVALDANSLSALENVTVTVGAAITGTVTVGNFPATQAVSLASVPTHAISGTVTANLNLPSFAGGNGDVLTSAVQIGYYDADSGEFRKVDSLYNPLPVSIVSIGGVPNDNGIPYFGVGYFASPGSSLIQVSQDANCGLPINGTVTANLGSALPTGTNRIGVVTIGAGTVTIGAGTAQIGSVTASLAISATAITSGSFASLTSATLVPGNTARKMATVYNLGAGQLFVNAGATATTLGGGFMVALSSGDYYECDFTTTTLSALYATAGTCSWMSH